MPDHYKEGGTYPYIPNEASTRFNPSWWMSKEARDMLANSYIKSGMKEEQAYAEADKNLSQRIKDAREAEYEVTPLRGRRAEARPKATGVREKGLVSIAPKSLEQDPSSLITHELAHIGVKGTSRMTDADKELIERSYTKGQDPADFNAFNTYPSANAPIDEVYARVQVLRETAAKEGIYDPFKEQFTEKHYDELVKKYGTGEGGKNNPDPRIDNIQQLLRNIDKESAIKIMNTVAQAKPFLDSMSGFA